MYTKTSPDVFSNKPCIAVCDSFRMSIRPDLLLVDALAHGCGNSILKSPQSCTYPNQYLRGTLTSMEAFSTTRRRL